MQLEIRQVKVIPPVLIKCDSSAERKVHRWLSEVHLSDYDVALHSVNFSEHEYKRWAEADFVVFSERGIVVLEVKGGRVACQDGVWEFTNRYDETNKKNESPVNQAKTAYHSSLRDGYLDPVFGRDLRRVPGGWGVVFTNVSRLVDRDKSALPEHPDEITAYKDDVTDAARFTSYMSRLFDHWSSKVSGAPRQLGAELIDEMVAHLRPNFERFPGLDSHLSGLREELFSLTEEQYQRLEDIQDNDRILIYGGAGTGKTFLALAVARYEAASGRSCLLVTRSTYLAAFIRSQGLPGEVVVMAFDELANSSSPEMVFDVLIVDEGQDLCQLDTLGVLEKVIQGGFHGGRWRWFGDPNNQVSPIHPIEDLALELLEDNCTKQRLSQNIRNAPPIVDKIETYARADLGAPRAIGQGSDVTFIEAEFTQERHGRAVERVKRWVRDKDDSIPPRDIAVLVPAASDIDAIVRSLNEGGVRAEALAERTFGKGARRAVVVSTIEHFKGLDRPIVVIAGLPGTSKLQKLRQVVYRGFSRANHTLVVICSKQQMVDLAKSATSQR